MSKEQISTDYMATMKAIHADKVLRAREARFVMITGATRPGNIGQAIETYLRNKKYGTVYATAMDVRDPLQPGMFSEVDTLVCCHAITHLDWIEECPPPLIDAMIDINLTSTIRYTQRFIQDTLHAPYKKQIVMIGSMAYRCVLNASAVYCASKAGLAHYAKCLAWELAPKGYDVFILHPSNTEGTPMTEDTIQGIMRYRGVPREVAEGYWGACLPKGKWLQATDIARLVGYLLSGRGEYLSGTQIDLPGGQR